MSEAPVPIVEVTVGAPIELVWQSLRDPELIKLWMGWHYDGLAAEISVIFGKKTQANEAEHTLQLGDGDRFELFERDGGTVVRMVRAPYVAGTEWSDYYHEITEGWLSFMQQLKFMHEEILGRSAALCSSRAPALRKCRRRWLRGFLPRWGMCTTRPIVNVV